MITAITASEKASSRSVVRSNGASDLAGSLIAAMIGLAPLLRTMEGWGA